MRRRNPAAGTPEDPARAWHELAERTRGLANIAKGSQRAAFLALADRYEATAARLDRGFEQAQEVLRGLEGSIRSNWQIELLLLLADDPDRQWSVAELTAELRSSERAVREALSSLRTAGLAEREPGGLYRYCPRTRQIADLVRRLARARAMIPVSVLAAIFSSRDGDGGC